MRNTDALKELADMIEDINRPKIVSHILDGTLDSWIGSWKTKSRTLMEVLLENEKVS